MLAWLELASSKFELGSTRGLLAQGSLRIASLHTFGSDSSVQLQPSCVYCKYDLHAISLRHRVKDGNSLDWGHGEHVVIDDR